MARRQLIIIKALTHLPTFRRLLIFCTKKSLGLSNGIRVISWIISCPSKIRLPEAAGANRILLLLYQKHSLMSPASPFYILGQMQQSQQVQKQSKASLLRGEGTTWADRFHAADRQETISRAKSSVNKSTTTGKLSSKSYCSGFFLLSACKWSFKA